MPDTIVPRSIFSPEARSPDDYPGGRQRKAGHALNKKWFTDNIAYVTGRNLHPDRVLAEVQRYHEIYTIMEQGIESQSYV